MMKARDIIKFCDGKPKMIWLQGQPYYWKIEELCEHIHYGGVSWRLYFPQPGIDEIILESIEILDIREVKLKER